MGGVLQLVPGCYVGPALKCRVAGGGGGGGGGEG